jgi:ribosome-binding protein aMBF1 (putative translation factor)
MKPSRKRRLQAAGFKVGSAAEFLGLTPIEELIVELRLTLAQEVRRRRLALGISQADLAKKLGSSQSRIAKLEAAEANVSIDLLFRALLAIGAKLPEVGKVIAAA